MAQPRRPPIPAAAREALLYRNDHTCCICNDRSRDVQIHHIDGDPANNAPENLAVVCLDCHSRVTGARGLGQSYRPGEVRKYKRTWERRLEARRHVHRPAPVDAGPLAAQVDLIVCEILASQRDAKKAPRLLEVLYNLNLWRGEKSLRKRVVEGQYKIA